MSNTKIILPSKPRLVSEEGNKGIYEVDNLNNNPDKELERFCTGGDPDPDFISYYLLDVLQSLLCLEFLHLLCNDTTLLFLGNHNLEPIKVGQIRPLLLIRKLLCP